MKGAPRYAVLPSPLTPLVAVFQGTRLCQIHFTRAASARAVAPRGADRIEPTADEAVARLADDLARYFAGESAVFRTKLDLSAGTPFRRLVWRMLCRVPLGSTISYGELAARVGSPRAARAVGQAMGANPIPILIPCHRVIRSDGALGGFGAGLPIKRWLLRHEGAIG